MQFQPFQTSQQLPTQTAISQSLPAPVGGWNARDPLESMPVTDAVTLTNVFPSTRTVDLRKGYREHADGMGSGAVETIVEHVDGDGTKYLLAAANSNIYDATTFGGSATSEGSGFTNNRWQTVL